MTHHHHIRCQHFRRVHSESVQSIRVCVCVPVTNRLCLCCARRDCILLLRWWLPFHTQVAIMESQCSFHTYSICHSVSVLLYNGPRFAVYLDTKTPREREREQNRCIIRLRIPRVHCDRSWSTVMDTNGSRNSHLAINGCAIQPCDVWARDDTSRGY